MKNAVDKTVYARMIGYRGTKAVLVLDSKVVSHRGLDWFEFCRRVRARYYPN